MAVAHNLRTLARVRAMKEAGFLIILWIYSTNSIIPKRIYVRDTLGRYSLNVVRGFTHSESIKTPWSMK
jgi:hypothetical protein